MLTGSRVRLAALLCAAAVSASAPAADTSVHGTVKREIEAALRAQEAANVNGENGEQLANRLYAPDVALVGGHEPHIRHGRAAAAKSVEAWRESLGPKGQAGCKFELDEPFVASRTAAASFIILRCKANPPALPNDTAIRMMYVWKRLPEGWRVALEMWAEGDR